MPERRAIPQQDGVNAKKARRATLSDVATLAGVSIKTVSRVVNSEPNVRDRTQVRVQAAIDQLKYKPNLSARRLATRRSYIIALLYDNPSAHYLFDIQNGVLSACKKHGYDLLVHPCDHKSPDLAEEVIALLEQGRCDGVILTPPLSDLQEVIKSLERSETPYIQIAPAHQRKTPSWVATTDEAAGCGLTKHLLDLGHRRIGYIRGHPDHKAMASREKGYRHALGSAGLVADEELILQGFNNFESGRQAADKLLSLPKPPTAIFAANDDMAAGAIKAARDRQLDVPGQVSIVGFDDTPAAQQTWPELTTIHQPIREMAEVAGGILIAGLNAEPPSISSQIFKTRLVIRDSTGPACE